MAFTAGPAAASIETSQLVQPVMCISADPAPSSFRRAALQLRPRLGEFYPMRLRGGSTWLPSCIRPRAVATADAAESVSGASRVLQSPADRDKPQVVFILGGPGAGKGTQCGKLVEDFRGVKHLSAGDLLRAERSSGSEQGEMIDRYMAEGKIIPVEVTARLLKEAIDKDKSEVALFLIDGFPRNADNLECWVKLMTHCKVHSRLTDRASEGGGRSSCDTRAPRCCLPLRSRSTARMAMAKPHSRACSNRSVGGGPLCRWSSC